MVCKSHYTINKLFTEIKGVFSSQDLWCESCLSRQIVTHGVKDQKPVVEALEAYELWALLRLHARRKITTSALIKGEVKIVYVGMPVRRIQSRFSKTQICLLKSKPKFETYIFWKSIVKIKPDKKIETWTRTQKSETENDHFLPNFKIHHSQI